MLNRLKAISSHRLVMITAIVGLLALAGSAGVVRAQSIDRDNPSPLTSNEVRGQGIGKNVEHFYSFLAGPGEVILTTDARAKAYSTFFEVLVFNMDAHNGCKRPIGVDGRSGNCGRRRSAGNR